MQGKLGHGVATFGRLLEERDREIPLLLRRQGALGRTIHFHIELYEVTNERLRTGGCRHLFDAMSDPRKASCTTIRLTRASVTSSCSRIAVVRPRCR